MDSNNISNASNVSDISNISDASNSDGSIPYHLATLCALNTTMFVFLCLPGIVMDSVILVVLTRYSPSVDKNIKKFQLNIVASSLLILISLSIWVVGDMITAGLRVISEEGFHCHIVGFAFIGGNVAHFLSMTTYSVVCYLFIRFGNAVKRHGKSLVGVLVATWVFSLLWSTPALLPDRYNYGFTQHRRAFVCGFVISEHKFPWALLHFGVSWLILDVIATSLTVCFTLAAYCYAKNMALGEGSEVKKSMVRYIVFLAVFSATSIVVTMVIPILSFAFGSTDSIHASYFPPLVSLCLLAIPIPVSMVWTVKTTRELFKKAVLSIKKHCFSHCSSSEEQ